MARPAADYTAVAALARSKPLGTWVEWKVGVSSANLVTRQRSGGILDLPPEEFEARASRVTADGVRAFDLEVRVEPPVSQTAVYAASNAIHAAGLHGILSQVVEQRLQRAIENEVADILRRRLGDAR